MVLSGFYGVPTPDHQRFAVLDRALELGATFWDSADGYGDNEELIGEWFRRTGKREEIFLATKFAIQTKPDGSIVLNNDPQYVREACEKSLRRLGIESIDVYYCHRLNGKVPVEHVVKAMAELVAEGKVKHIGLSEVSSTSLRRAHAVHPIAAVQVEYSPFTLDIESTQTSLLQTCRELGVAVVAYSPLGRGVLTTNYKSPQEFEEGDWRHTSPRFKDENFEANLKLREQLELKAYRKGCTISQLVLAWLMAQGEDIFPIPGTKRTKYLEENMGALKVHLTQEEIAAIREACEELKVSGNRYPEHMMGALFADTPPLDT